MLKSVNVESHTQRLLLGFSGEALPVIIAGRLLCFEMSELDSTLELSTEDAMHVSRPLCSPYKSRAVL